jgi:hypothetical protein
MFTSLFLESHYYKFLQKCRSVISHYYIVTQNAYHPRHAIIWFISKHAEHNSYVPWLCDVPVTIQI